MRTKSWLSMSTKWSLKLKGKIYGICVWSCRMYGREIWPMKKEHESVLERTEMGCIVPLWERRKLMSVGLINQLNIYFLFVMHGKHFKTLMHKLFTIWHMFFSEDVPKYIFFSIWANQGDLKNQYLWNTIIGNNFWMTQRNIEKTIYRVASLRAGPVGRISYNLYFDCYYFIARLASAEPAARTS